MAISYNPAQVMMGQPSTPGAAYISGKPVNAPSGSPVLANKNPLGQTPQPQQSTTVGPQAVRATGTGPFDSAYRQNLATYAGGLFGSPTGNLSFNPTSGNPFGGAATGGGNAPLFGIPNTQLQNALGGQPFAAQTPPPPAQATQNV